MKRIILISVCIVSALFFLQCKKNQLGGKSKVNGTVMHHTKAIAGAIVYIKFNAKDFPGEDVSVYDSYVTANESGYYEINNFYKGDYYLFATGIDMAIGPPYKVRGGLGVSLKSHEEKTIDIPVGEE